VLTYSPVDSFMLVHSTVVVTRPRRECDGLSAYLRGRVTGCITILNKPFWTVNKHHHEIDKFTSWHIDSMHARPYKSNVDDLDVSVSGREAAKFPHFKGEKSCRERLSGSR
jgi:hypothetical protein